MTNRRKFLTTGAAIASMSAISCSPSMAAEQAPVTIPTPMPEPVTFALNTATLRGHELSIVDQVDVVARAGYDGFEPWIRDIENYAAEGGSLADLNKRIRDAGLSVVSAIGFANWIVDNDAARAKGLEDAKREMSLVQAIGGTRVAAPPVGLHGKDATSPPLAVIGDRYRDLLNVGQSIGVTPQLELWGFSPTISKLAELAYVATAAAHPLACILPDFYHIYKGGNDFEGLAMIESSKIHCFHINDYPASPTLDKIGDKDRVFPGDGVCDLPRIIRGLIDRGFTGTFSLELFNPEYWKRDALEIATEGLVKSKAVVELALQIK